MTRTTGKRALIDVLRQERVGYVFGIPGATEIQFMDALEEAPDIRYIPFQGGELHVFKSPPGTALANEFGLVEAVDGLGQSIIVGIPPGPHRGDGAGPREALGVADGEVLDTAVTMVDETLNVVTTAPQGHL